MVEIYMTNAAVTNLTCKLRYLSILMVLQLMVLFSAHAALAQRAPPISLLADSIRVNQNSGLLIASGNVQIFYEGRLLTAAEIRYDSKKKTIIAIGPITIREPDGTVFTAEYAELSENLRDGVIRGARLLLADQLQLASAEIRRTANRFNSMTNVVASSCQVCLSRPTPVWQIRAQQITHDELRQRIYFRNATLEILGIPVAFLPYLRTPSPEVQRATGFLVPTFLSSDYFGDGLKIPYYITLGDHADTTITPTVTLQGAQLIDMEYRQRFSSGGFDLFGAFAISDENGDDGRGFATVEGAFVLPRDVILSFDGTILSDYGFMKQFSYSNTDRVVSEISLSRYDDRNYFSVAAASLLSLRDDENNDRIPLVFPEFSYRSYQTDLFVGGKIGYSLNGVGLTRDEGQNMTRVGGSVDWMIPLELRHGVRAKVFAEMELDFYRVRNSEQFPEGTLTSFHPTLGAEVSWPLGQSLANSRHVFQPVIQVIYTADPSWNDAVPNEDSRQVEFDETNLFDLNRHPGQDASEMGLRTNLGATYTIFNDNGWEIGAAAGIVLRSETNRQFSQDILGAVSFEFPPNFSAIGRILLDEEFVVKRTEAELDISLDRFDLGGSFVYLLADPRAGSDSDRSEGTLRGSYRLTPSWEVDMRWTRNFITGKPVRASGGITYGNECIEIELSLSRRYTASEAVPSSTDIDLVVQLAGFGGSGLDKWPAARCSF